MKELNTIKGKRMLAAIMFTDMIGYTALMQNDEQQAKQNRDRHRLIQKNAVYKYKGEILQYYGDGTLIIFKSAIEAVSCAVEIQTELQKDPVIPLRIGIHIGDIVYDDEGIYGDGVNVASRIENLSISGSVLISGKMMDEIKNQPQFSTEHIGSFNLKNVKRPIRVFAISNEGLHIPKIQNLNNKLDKHIRSIAVLPFVSLSSDPENEYFSDGITEELLNALTRVEGLQVTARTSSFAFKGRNIDIREIGKQLGVKTVLEGSVRKAGNRVRITAQLISVADGYHIWSETYDRQLEDIFEIQDEISLKIANKLRKKLSIESTNEKLVLPSTKDLDAYNLYLKAVFYQNKWTLKDSQIAIKLLEEAINIDPKFATAYATIAMIYGFLGASGKMPPVTAYPKAKEYAFLANQIDENLPESHLALANYYFWLEFNLKEAKKHVNQAIKLNPSLADAYLFKALFLNVSNRAKEASVYIKLSMQLDPFSMAAKLINSRTLYWMGKKEEAIEEINKILEISPAFSGVYHFMSLMAFEDNDLVSSRSYLEKMKETHGSKEEYSWAQGLISIKEKDLKTAEKYLETLIKINENSDRSGFFLIGSLYGLLGDTDKMFDYFDKSIEAKESYMIFIHKYKILEQFYTDPRFQKILKKIGLPELAIKQ